MTLIVSGHIKYQKIEKVKGFVLSKKTNEFIVILEENRDLHLRSDKRKDIIITISKIILSHERKLECFLFDDLNLEDYITDFDGVSKKSKTRGKKAEFILVD